MCYGNSAALTVPEKSSEVSFISCDGRVKGKPLRENLDISN